MSGGSLVPINANGGWPGLARANAAGREVNVALHVSNVSTHARAAYERRFQNPGDRTPVSAPPGYVPVLCGLAYVAGKPIVVAIPGSSRLGREARFSILFNVSILQSAALTGWSEYTSNTGEVITAMDPRLLAAFVDALSHGVTLEPTEVSDAADAFDLVDDPDPDAGERTRAVMSRLVRKATFGRDVCRAYAQRCAMCGVGLNLLEGAHILPASNPGSTDKIWNGIALCRNHHRVFDRHEIWVNPDTWDIRWHPRVLDNLRNEADTNFVENSLDRILLPGQARHHPRSDMFRRRYAGAAASLEWVA